MYMSWCLSNSKGSLNENIVVVTGEPPAQSMINPTEITSLDTYNCQKLWEDELKFSLAILVIMTICYVSIIQPPFLTQICILTFFHRPIGVFVYSITMRSSEISFPN